MPSGILGRLCTAGVAGRHRGTSCSFSGEFEQAWAQPDTQRLQVPRCQGSAPGPAAVQARLACNNIAVDREPTLQRLGQPPQ